MGFSHYLTPTKTATQEQWEAFTKKAKEIIDAFGEPVYNWNGEEEGAEITNDMIRLNGCAAKDEDHETFHIERNSGTWDFCKTARKPYDTVVVALLIVGQAMGIIESWSSDGDEEDGDFDEARELIAKVNPD